MVDIDIWQIGLYNNGAVGTNFPACGSWFEGRLWIGGASFIRLIAPDVSNPHADGLRVEAGSHDIDIYDANVHHVGEQGILVQGVTAAVDRVRLVRYDVSRWGLKATTDGAYDQYHGVYWGGGAYGHASGELRDGHVYDGDFGAAHQFGPYAKDVVCDNSLIERITGAHWKPGTSDGAGNAFNLYGGKVTGLVIDGAHGSGISGNAVDADGSLNSAAGSAVVKSARFGQTGRQPAYIQRPGVTYQDCS